VHYDSICNRIWSFAPSSTSEDSWSMTMLEPIAEKLNMKLGKKVNGLFEPTQLDGRVGQPIVFANDATSIPLDENILALERIRRHVISAVLGTIMYQLSHHLSLIPLNSRTLVLLPELAQDFTSRELSHESAVSSIMITVYVSLTTLGSLVVKLQPDLAPGLRQLSKLSRVVPDNAGHSRPSLWLAPGAFSAQYHDCISSEISSNVKLLEESLTQITAQTDLSPADYNIWKTEITEWLSSIGVDMDIVVGSPWVYVRLLDSKTFLSRINHSQSFPNIPSSNVIPWPERLCFTTQSLLSTSRHLNSRPFMTDGDPLSFAEQWMSRSEERNIALARRKKDRQDREQIRKVHTETNSNPTLPLVTSPATVRRSSNAGAIYPTPPDALQHHIGATPNFDGVTFTPGPSVLSSIDGQILGPPPPDQQVALSNADLWMSEEKKDRNLPLDTYQNNDDLFGEMDEDLFGNDVTDADFSFFDEPDDFPPRVTISDVTGGTDSHLIDASLDAEPIEVALTVGPDIMNVDVEDQVVINTVEEVGESAPNSEDVVMLPVEHCENEDEAKPMVELVPELQAISPPFNKTVIFKRLIKDQAARNTTKRPKQGNLFGMIEFDGMLSASKHKYDRNGQFAFADPSSKLKTLNDVVENRVAKSGEEKSDLTFKHVHFLPDAEHNSTAGLLEDSELGGHAKDSTGIHAEKIALQAAESDTISGNSPQNTLSQGISTAAQTPTSAIGPQSTYTQDALDTWPLTGFVTASEPTQDIVTLTDLERIATAQIIADQAISSTLRLPRNEDSRLPEVNASSSKKYCRLQGLLSAVNACLKDFRHCSMKGYLDVQGTPAFQAPRLPPRPIPPVRGPTMLELAKANNPYLMPSSRLEVKRADSKLTVLPSAVNFWNNLGLGPSNGNKDISAVCAFPSFDGIQLHANTFLEQMRSHYESFRLGNHDRVNTKDTPDGLLSYPSSVINHAGAKSLASMRETIGLLGRTFATCGLQEQNLVVYFIYPLEQSELLVHACSAFQHLFTMYRKALAEKKMANTNELVLQLVPLDFVYQEKSLVVPTSVQYSRLAMETYDRCISFSSSTTKSAILLEQPLPKMIDFKLSTTPSAAILQENTCLHIAYAQSIDERWISVAWTDNKGAQQMTSSYCLGRRHEELSMSFHDIASEIWATTISYTSKKKIHWRLMIARVGIMDPEEIESWTILSEAENASKVSLTLITVQPDPSICMLPNPVTLVPSASVSQSVITPASTPQASQTTFSSQDVNTPTPGKDVAGASTPGEAPTEPDNDAFLIDFTDQTWGAVLSHRLSNSHCLLECNPALMSGYLIKRTGMHADDAPVVMEVNIIYTDVQGNPRTIHESLLREILAYYRGLGTLARVRGLVDGKEDCRPWHVVAVQKAVEALYILL